MLWAIDGQKVHGMRLVEVLELIQGSTGVGINLTFLRNVNLVSQI